MHIPSKMYIPLTVMTLLAIMLAGFSIIFLVLAP